MRTRDVGEALWLIRVRWGRLMKEGGSMNEVIFLVEESPEGGYEARGLGYPIFSEADSLEELKEAVRDAVSCHFEEGERPAIIRLHLTKDEVIPV